MTLWIQQKHKKQGQTTMEAMANTGIILWQNRNTQKNNIRIGIKGSKETCIAEMIQQRAFLQLSVLTRPCDSFVTWRFEQEMQRS